MKMKKVIADGGGGEKGRLNKINNDEHVDGMKNVEVLKKKKYKSEWRSEQCHEIRKSKRRKQEEIKKKEITIKDI